MDTRTGKIVPEDQIPPAERGFFIPVTRDLSIQERNQMQIKRYSPCACGSGKKFKFCCYKLPPQEILEKAFDYLQLRLREARYRHLQERGTPPTKLALGPEEVETLRAFIKRDMVAGRFVDDPYQDELGYMTFEGLKIVAAPIPGVYVD